MADATYHHHIDPALFYFQAEVKPGFRTEAVEMAIYDEIDRLKRGDLSIDELNRAKRQIEAELVLNNEEPLQQAILLGQYQTTAVDPRLPDDSRGYLYLETMLERTVEVSLEDVARVTNRYFTEDNRTVGYLRDVPQEQV
jgi:zinc protease